MARSTILFQKGLSLSGFQRLYGTEEQCEAALEKARWPDGFRCPDCNGEKHGLVYGRRLKRYQCRTCSHQATLSAGTIMQATKLPLTTRFLAFYSIAQAKTGISSLELSRHLGVKDDTAWLLYNKILRAMACLLRGKIQIDDSYLGGKLAGGKAGRGSENKIPIVASDSLNEAGHPIHARITAVSGFSSEAIGPWAIGTGGKHPNELPQFRWINTVLGNLKTSFNGTPSMLSTLTSTPSATSAATASASAGAFRWLRWLNASRMLDAAISRISGLTRLMGNQVSQYS